MHCPTHTLGTVGHVAVLDPLSGYGLLILPNQVDDIADPIDPLGQSLHELALTDALTHLSREGWQASEELPIRERGRLVLPLARDDDAADLAQAIDAHDRLWLEADRLP